jgi:hypothetical protein
MFRIEWMGLSLVELLLLARAWPSLSSYDGEDEVSEVPANRFADRKAGDSKLERLELS